MRTIPTMAVPQKVQVTLTPRDRSALDALINELPWLEEPGAAPLLRSLMRLGLRVYAENPLGQSMLAQTTHPPSADWLTTTTRSALARRATVEGTPGPETLMAQMNIEARPGVVPPQEAAPPPRVRRSSKGPKVTDRNLTGGPTEKDREKHRREAKD